MQAVRVASLLLLAMAAAQAMPHYVFCAQGLDSIEEARASPSDVLDIYYVQAPAFEAVYGDLFKSVGGYHTALGIVIGAVIIGLSMIISAAVHG